MYDVIILGGGAAGLTAALYTRRYGLSALLIEELYLGGQIINTAEIENYPGYSTPISGMDLMSEFEKQARNYDPVIVYETVTGVFLNEAVKTVKTEDNEYKSRCVIIATGQNSRELGVARERELRGSGVSYCAVCDGNFFRGKTAAVVGGGDTALTEALFLSRICRKVFIIHRRDSFRAAQAEVNKLKKTDNIEPVMNARVIELLGAGKVEGVTVCGAGGSLRTLEINALFIAVGAIPKSGLFKDILALDEYGYIITDDDMRASIPGVFAAGDVRKKALRQLVTAASDGATAAHNAMLYIQEE